MFYIRRNSTPSLLDLPDGAIVEFTVREADIQRLREAFNPPKLGADARRLAAGGAVAAMLATSSPAHAALTVGPPPTTPQISGVDVAHPAQLGPAQNPPPPAPSPQPAPQLQAAPTTGQVAQAPQPTPEAAPAPVAVQPASAQPISETAPSPVAVQAEPPRAATPPSPPPADPDAEVTVTSEPPPIAPQSASSPRASEPTPTPAVQEPLVVQDPAPPAAIAVPSVSHDSATALPKVKVDGPPQGPHTKVQLSRPPKPRPLAARAGDPNAADVLQAASTTGAALQSTAPGGELHRPVPGPGRTEAPRKPESHKPTGWVCYSGAIFAGPGGSVKVCPHAPSHPVTVGVGGGVGVKGTISYEDAPPDPTVRVRGEVSDSIGPLSGSIAAEPDLFGPDPYVEASGSLGPHGARTGTDGTEVQLVTTYNALYEARARAPKHGSGKTLGGGGAQASAQVLIPLDRRDLPDVSGRCAATSTASSGRLRTATALASGRSKRCRTRDRAARTPRLAALGPLTTLELPPISPTAPDAHSASVIWSAIFGRWRERQDAHRSSRSSRSWWRSS